MYEAAHAFYEKHGGKAIVIARFVPLVRTFVPVVAGVAGMRYRDFALFNVIGGIGWVVSMTVGGYFLGSVFPDMGKHIEKVIIVIVAALGAADGDRVREGQAREAGRGRANPLKTSR